MLKVIIIVLSFFLMSKFNVLKNNTWIKKQVSNIAQGKSDEEIKGLISKLNTLEFVPIVLILILSFIIKSTLTYSLATLIIVSIYFILASFILNFQKERDPIILEKELDIIRTSQNLKSATQSNKQKEQSIIKSSSKNKSEKETLEPVQTNLSQTDKKAGLFSTSTYCPHCRSMNVSFMQNNKKGFSVGKAVGGAALTGGIGTLAGFAGKKGKNQWHCQNCGKTFETKK